MAIIADIPTDVAGKPLKCSSKVYIPKCTPDQIELPRRTGMKFFSLKNGTQFLVCYPFSFGFGDELIEGRSFFGGMDESLFVTGIQKTAVDAFSKDGENGFYESLIPESVKLLKQEFCTEAQRQGDVWFCRLPWKWSLINRYWWPHEPVGKCSFLDTVPAKSIPVLGLRHYLLGRYYSRGRIAVGKMQFPGLTVGEGTLTTRHHAPRLCVGGPHAFARTPHIERIPWVDKTQGWD